jgi:hypothetical protein
MARVLLGLLLVLTVPTAGSAGDAVDRDLVALTAEAMQGRGPGSEGLARAADWIEGRLEELGLAPAFSAGYRQVFEDDEERPWVNLAAVQGKGPRHVLLGAHYDHLGIDAEGRIHPGADDNASGVAAVLEAARILADDPPGAAIVFVFFAAEEEGLLGSRWYVDHPALPLASCIAMVNLDTVGRLAEGGLTVFGAETSPTWGRVLPGVGLGFGLEPDLPPSDPGGSDQIAFVEKGVAAVQLFTGAHADYHRPTDTLDKIDRGGVATVGAFAAELVLFLAEEPRPLSFVPPGAEKAPEPPPGGTRRRVSVGTIPDFNHQGEGILLSGVIPGSPAEGAGLQAGDLLLEVGGTPVDDLAAYAEVLAAHAPGDLVVLVYRRNEERRSAEVTLVERR